MPICSTDPGVLRMYVVYRKPSDFPDEYVIRERLVLAGVDVPGELVARGPTLEAVRDQLMRTPRGPGLYRIARDPSADPVIVETWV
jgi:hypothetical protein